MRASIILGISLFLIISTGFAASANHDLTSDRRVVPISEIWEFYTENNLLSFSIKECGIHEYKGGYQPGDLLVAATQAAAEWNRAFPSVVITIQSASCTGSPPNFRNGSHEIYWSGYTASASNEVGNYTGYFLTDGTLVEHDIAIEPSHLGNFISRNRIDPQTALFNIVLHEMGHAIGLNDAYLVDSLSCDWSVMLMLCAGPRMAPTAADVAALQHIFGFAPREQSGGTIQPAPPPTTAPPSFNMARFDTNRNGLIDDEELFFAVDIWTAGGITDEQFSALVDAWITQVRVQAIRPKTQSAPFAVDVFDTNGNKIASLSCAMGDTKVRVGRELDRKNAPSATYIMRTRDCSNNKLEIMHAYFQGDIRY
jgi:hypothetical protein